MRRYTPEEDAMIRATARDPQKLKELATQLGRTYHSLRMHAMRLGISAGRHNYTIKEIAAIRQCIAQGGDWKALAKSFGVSLDAVLRQAYKLGYRSKRNKRYTPDEDRLIREYCEDGGDLRELAARLGRTIMAIHRRMCVLRVSHPRCRDRIVDRQAAILRLLERRPHTIAEISDELRVPIRTLTSDLSDLRKGQLIRSRSIRSSVSGRLRYEYCLCGETNKG